MCPAFAFLAACAFALGTVLQQKGTLATTSGDSYWLIQILREPVWLPGLEIVTDGRERRVNAASPRSWAAQKERTDVC